MFLANIGPTDLPTMLPTSCSATLRSIKSGGAASVVGSEKPAVKSKAKPAKKAKK